MRAMAREGRLRSLMRRQGCGYVLISDPVSVAYYSGFRASRVYLLLSRRKKLLFTDGRYREAAKKFCARRPDVRFVEIGQKAPETVVSFIPAGSRVGVESNTLSVDRFADLRRAGGSLHWRRLGSSVVDIASVKNSEEIGAIRRAARIGDRAFKRFCSRLRPGITEVEAAAELERLCREYGAEAASFPTIVLFGPRSALPHGFPGRRRLRKGDFVLTDFGCVVSGLCSDMTRTKVFGKAGEKQRGIYDTVLRAQRTARRAVGPGVKASEVDRSARTVIDEAGYGEFFIHATGHGVGRRVHERPRLSDNDSTVLEAGMVVTIEPGIYVPGVGGTRIEDMVLVADTGSQLLTHSPRRGIEI